MQDTQNDEIISNGFDYFRNVEYVNRDVVDFAIEIMGEYNERGRQAVQYAIFYLGDNTDALNSEDEERIKEYILDILKSEVASISLAALEFVPKFYTEGNSKYASTDEESDTSMTEEVSDEEEDAVATDASTGVGTDASTGVGTGASTGVGTDASTGVGTGGDEKNPEKMTQSSSEDHTEADGSTKAMEANRALFSTSLKEFYDTTSNTIVRSQTVLTLGQIEAYSQIDFIVEVANSATTVGLRGEAIKALAHFAKVPQDIIEKRDTLYEESINDESPSVRISTIESLGVVLEREENMQYIEWLKKALRDGDKGARETALETIYDLFSEKKIANVAKEFKPVLEYIVQYDPELKVKNAAVKALSQIQGGNEFIVKEIDSINYLYSSAKFYITSALNDIPDDGGIQAIERFAVRSIEKKYESNLEFVATEMSKISNDNLGKLVAILIAYPNSSILSACLVTIGKNNLKVFNSQVKGLSQDITQPASIRNKAREIVSIQDNKAESEAKITE